MNIGEKIRQLRIHKKKTQGELVENISSITYLSRIENGKIKPSYRFLEEISNRLNISVHDLVNDDISDKEKKITYIINNYKKTKTLTEEEISLLSMSAKEPYSSQILIRIFETLLRYYLDQKQLSKTKEVYELSKKIIPEKFDHTLSDLFSAYFIACGRYFYITQTYSEADRYFSKAESLMDLEDTTESAKLYYNISLVKQRIMKDKTIALYYSKKAYDLFLKAGDRESVCKVLITRGVQYHLIEEYITSRDILLEARDYIHEEDAENSLNGMIEYNLGRVYQGLNDFDKSIIHFKKSIEINENLHLDEEKIYSLRSLIEIYYVKKQWDYAHQLFIEAVQIAKEKNLNYVLVELKGMNAKSYLLRGDHYSFEREMQAVIELGKKLKQEIILSRLAVDLANHYYEIRAYKKASDYYKIAVSKN